MPDLPTFHGDPSAFDKTTARKFRHYDLLLGHFSFCHVWKFRKPLALITFLRDPVERVLSSYYFLREAEPATYHPHDTTKIAKHLSLEEFLRCDLPAVRMLNVDLQCHALTTDWRGPYNPDRRALVAGAIENLSRFAFVGLVERFEDDIRRLAQLLDSAPPPAGYHLNKTKNRRARSEINPGIVKLIEDLNAGDRALYDHVSRSRQA